MSRGSAARRSLPLAQLLDDIGQDLRPQDDVRLCGVLGHVVAAAADARHEEHRRRADRLLSIRATTDLVQLLRPSQPLPTAYRFIEQEIGGIRPWSVSIRTGAGDLLEPQVLKRVASFQDWLDRQPEVEHTFSIVDYLRRMHQAKHGGDPAFFELPDSRAQVATYLLLLDDPSKNRTAPFLYPDWEEPEEARVLVRTRSLPTAEMAALGERMKEYTREHLVTDPRLFFDPAALRPPLTGVEVIDSPVHRIRGLLGEGTKPTLAKLSLARLIAATVLRMWKNEEEYDPGRAGLPAKTRRDG